jgi:hypothetical protein
MPEMFTQDEVNDIVERRLARERRTRGEGDTRVMAEPRKYSLESPYSWYADVASRAENGNQAPAAILRMTEYERELGWHMAHGTREGRRAEDILRVLDRTPNAEQHERRHAQRVRELRGFGTDGGIKAEALGEAAAVVSPAFLLDQWAPFRGAARSFTDQCLKVPLPSYGMKVYVPYFSATDEVTEQTEGGAVAEADPTTALEASPTVATITGQIAYSQQLRDRGGSGGGSMDVIIGKQLQQQLDERVDKYVLARVIEQGNAVAGKSSYTTKGLYEDVAKGREKIVDTAGTRLRPTHLFTTSDLYAYATDQVDSSERPILQPQFIPGFPLAADADSHDEDNQIPAWARFTGTVLPAGLLWFTDDNIPTVGTTAQTQLLVSSPGDAVIVMEDPPILTPFVETKANELKVILNLRSYVAVVTRHSAGTSVISGNAYVSSEK